MVVNAKNTVPKGKFNCLLLSHKDCRNVLRTSSGVSDTVHDLVISFLLVEILVIESVSFPLCPFCFEEMLAS